MVRKCQGLGLEQCRFGKGGTPAQPKHPRAQCTLCNTELLKSAVCDASGSGRLLQTLRSLQPDVVEIALQRLPWWCKGEMKEKLKEAPKKKKKQRRPDGLLLAPVPADVRFPQPVRLWKGCWAVRCRPRRTAAGRR